MMTAMSPAVILAYLHHDRATVALEQLRSLEVAGLPWAKPAEQRRELARLRREAEGGLPPTPAEEAAERQALWDAEWARLRSRLGPGRPAGAPRRPGAAKS